MPDDKTREIRVIIPEALFDFLVPGEAHEHLAMAKKEILLAIRSLIDARIEMIEKRGTRKGSLKRKIKVE
jgi:hypothetical protein